MGLPARVTHIPAGLPIDQSTRPELLPAGSANVANVNVRNIERGALEKRRGFGAMSSVRLDDSSRASGLRIVPHEGNPCVIDANANLDAYVGALDAWTTTGPIPEAVYTLQSVPSPTTDANVFDSATVSGMIAIAYGKSEDSAAIMAVLDATDGSVISPLTLLGTSPGDRGLHAVGAIKGQYFIAVTTDSTNILAYVFDTQNISTGWTLIDTIATDSAVAYPSICSLSDRIVIGYGISSGINRVVIKAIDETGEIDTTTALATSTPTFVDVDGSSNDVVWVTWDNGTAIRTLALSPASLTTVVGTAGIITNLVDDDMQSLRVCAGDTHNAQLWVMYKRTNLDGSHPALSIAYSVTIESGAVVRGEDGTASLTRFGVYANVIISSRPLFRDGRYYVFVAAGAGDPEKTGANDQGTCVLVDWTLTHTNLRPVANVEPSISTRLQVWSKIAPLDANRLLYARQFIKGGSEQSLTAAYGASLVVVDFASVDRWGSVGHNGVTVLGGGVVGVWDGSDFTELGFLHRPRPPVVNIVTPGDPGYLNGTYRYVAIFWDVDAAGNVVVSGVSGTKEVSLTNQTTTVEPQVTAVTYRTRQFGSTSGSVQSRIRTAVYRTIAGGEPPYYLVGFVPSASNLEDDLSDDDLRSRPKLYAPNLPGANGESLDRRAPPQLLHIVSYAGMLVGAKGGSVFYSGQPVYGEATWFSPVFEVPVTADDITGLAVLDGSIVVFTKSAVYLVAGEIPSDNGASGGLGQPRLISSDVGCISARSIVSCALGIFFQSDRGIEILTRSQSVEWVGEPIRQTLTAFPVVTSAVVDERNSLVRISLAESVLVDGAVNPYEGDSGGGRDIIFDTITKAWISVDDKRGATVHEASQDAALINVEGRRYAWLGSDGALYVESNEDSLDVGNFVAASYTIPPFSYGLQQEQRVFEVEFSFEKVSDVGLVIEVAENYGAFTAETPNKVWSSAELSAANGMVPFRPKSHGNAVQFRVRDTEPTGETEHLGNGGGLIFIGFSSDAAPKQGATRGTTRGNTELRR